MSHKTYLERFDLQYLNDLIGELYPLLYGSQNGTGLYGLLTDALDTRLVREAEQGDERAARILGVVQRDGLYTRVESYVPSMDRTRIGHNGRVLSMPTHIGVPARRRSGKRDGHGQQRLWFETSWDEFVEWLNGQRTLAVNMSTKVAMLEVIL